MSKGIENIKKNLTKYMFVLDLIIAVTIVFMVFVNIDSIGFVKVYSQEQEQNQTQANQTSIELTGKLIGTTYRWVDSNNSINPTLIVTSGVNNQITVKSLKDDSQEHELIIEGITSSGDKEELIISDIVHDGSSSIVDFYPLDLQEYKNYESFDYYCEYHPETMKGYIKITN
ncbi:MAG TPA: hypothetical protein VFP49_00745 [Nitrososphaeraceae archaeon]|nr:hypothetical protein [Nitrososphaeraceae archaeon]